MEVLGALLPFLVHSPHMVLGAQIINPRPGTLQEVSWGDGNNPHTARAIWFDRPKHLLPRPPATAIWPFFPLTVHFPHMVLGTQIIKPRPRTFQEVSWAVGTTHTIQGQLGLTPQNTTLRKQSGQLQMTVVRGVGASI